VDNAPSFDICGVGTAAVDDLLYVQRYPPADEKSAVEESRRSFGGLVATALAAASRIGCRCAYAGVLTDDELGAAVQGALGRAGVDCSLTTRRPDGSTTHSVIVCERPRGTRTIFFSRHRPYPVGALDIRSVVSSCRVLLVDQLGYEAACEARRRAVPVVADMEWPEQADCSAFMAVVDHLIVSRSFARAVTGLTEPAAMASRLHEVSPRACTAVTCGEAGCYYAAGASQVAHAPSPRVTAVETNGCGDVFHGAYAAALARGLEVAACIRAASAAAALFASRPGGWEHLATEAEVRALLERAGG
jgi:sulfofructose kinase